MSVLYPLTLFALIGATVAALCCVSLPRAERNWVMRCLFGALALRMAVATMFATIPETRMFHEDANGYEIIAMHMARGWHGDGPPFDLASLTENFGFPYVGAAVYYLFGQFRPLLSYFNCVIGMAAVFLVYQLARRFFHVLVARRAAVLVSLVPSMILWSAVAIKDPLMAVLILIGLNGCVALRRRFSIGAAIAVSVSLLAMEPIRFYMIFFLGFAILASLLLDRGIGLVSGIYKQVLIGGAVVVLFTITGFAGSSERSLHYMSFESVSNFRHNMAITANSGFDADVDVSTPGKALVFLPIGVSELLLGPFPWQFGSMRALMAAPETVYWWFLFPSMLRGLSWMTRKRFAEAAPLILFAATLTCAYSLVHGNVGSGFRQRAQIFIILFIFAALGQYRQRCRRAGLDEELLLVNGIKPAAPPVPRPSA